MLNNKYIILLLLFAISGFAMAENSWQLSRDEDEIQIYTRDNPTSAVKSFKSSMVIKSRLATLVSVIQDTNAYPRWLHDCKAAKKLKKTGNNNVFNYIVTGMPWPVADRDAIVHSVLSQNDKNKQIEIILGSAPAMIPPKNGMVRIQKLLGKWLLTPLESGQVNVVYEMNVDPGGNIPKWLVNALAVDLPFYTLQKLRQIVKEDKYANALVENITE